MPLFAAPDYREKGRPLTDECPIDTPQDLTTRCGYVALLGRPNAGKSTLLNAAVGFKLAGVSRKPQTTRQTLLGVTQRDGCQFLFVDTPGIHRDGKAKLNSLMNKVAWQGAETCDVMVYLVDGAAPLASEDVDYLASLIETKEKPLIVALSKADRVKNFELKKTLAGLKDALCAKGLDLTSAEGALKFTLVSAKDKALVADLLTLVGESLPLGPFMFDEETLSDKPEKYIVAELIREKVFRLVGREIPYMTTVYVEKLSFKNKTAFIDAVIVCGQKSHKGIILGDKGEKIKKIGVDSRVQLEDYFQKKVMLSLFVSVDENWFDKANLVDYYENPTS